MRKLLTFLTFTVSFAMMSTVFAGASGDSESGSSSGLTPEQEVQICKQHITEYPGGSYQFQSTDKSAGSPESCELDYQPNVTIYDQGDGVSYPPSSIPTSEPTIPEGPSKPPRRLTPESWEELERQDFCAQNPSQCRESTNTEDVTISPMEPPIETDTTTETGQSDKPTNDDSEFSFRPECTVGIDDSIPGCRDQDADDDAQEIMISSPNEEQQDDRRVDNNPEELITDDHNEQPLLPIPTVQQQDNSLNEGENRSPVLGNSHVSDACSDAQENFESAQKEMYEILIDYGPNPSPKNLGDLEYERANILKQIALLSALRQINEKYHRYLEEINNLDKNLDSPSIKDQVKDLINKDDNNVTTAKLYNDVFDLLRKNFDQETPERLQSASDIKNFCATNTQDRYGRCHLINRLEDTSLLQNVIDATRDESSTMTRDSIDEYQSTLSQLLPDKGVFDRQYAAYQGITKAINVDDNELRASIQNAKNNITNYQGDARSVLSNLNYEFNHNQSLEDYFKKYRSPESESTQSQGPKASQRDSLFGDHSRGVSPIQQETYPKDAKDILKNHFLHLAPDCQSCATDAIFDIFKEQNGSLSLDPDKTRHFLSLMNDSIHQEGDNDDKDILDEKIISLENELNRNALEIEKVHRKPEYLQSLAENQQAYSDMLTACGEQVGKSVEINPVSCNQDVGLIDNSLEQIIRFGKDAVRGVIVDQRKRYPRQRESSESYTVDTPPQNSPIPGESLADLDHEQNNGSPLPREQEITEEISRTPTSNNNDDSSVNKEPFKPSMEATHIKRNCPNGVWEGEGKNLQLVGCKKYNNLIPTIARGMINTVPVLSSTNFLRSHILIPSVLYGKRMKDQRAYNEHINAVFGGNQLNQWSQSYFMNQFMTPFGSSNMPNFGQIGSVVGPSLPISNVGIINPSFLGPALFTR